MRDFTDPIDYCVEVDWPGRNSFSTGYRRPAFGRAAPWVGSLIYHGRDPSGQMYRRNRFYDPQTGRFTQEDPIGIAGGLNVYGYAEGDPFTFSDSFGLSAQENCIRQPLDCLKRAWQRIGEIHVENHESMVRWYMDMDDHIPGAGMSRTDAEQFANASYGAMGGAGRVSVVTGQLSRLGGRLTNQLGKVNLRHLQAARAELRGVNTGWDHVTEVQDGMRGIGNTIRSLNRILADERLTRAERAVAQNLLSRASRALDAAEAYLSR